MHSLPLDNTFALPATTGPSIVGHPEWTREFVRSTDWIAQGRYAELRSQARSGELVKVAQGVFRWRTAATAAQRAGVHPDDDAYLARIRAAMLTAPLNHVVSHESAAHLWGLGTLSPWPPGVVATVPVGANSHSSPQFTRHAHDLRESVAIDGMRVTAIERTVADVARTLRRATAFELMCSALFTPRRGRPLTTATNVETELGRHDGARGVRAARALMAITSTGCESPAEARSLLLMHDLRFVRPEQQAVFNDGEGDMRVDFYWPHLALVGECDGLSKYRARDTGDGRGAAERVIEEKRREDRLRALGLRVVRWVTPTLADPRAFAKLFTTAGVPLVHELRR